MRHGKGKQVDENKNVFEGLWENDKKVKEGKFQFSDYSKYEGQI